MDVDAVLAPAREVLRVRVRLEDRARISHLPLARTAEAGDLALDLVLKADLFHAHALDGLHLRRVDVHALQPLDVARRRGLVSAVDARTRRRVGVRMHPDRSGRVLLYEPECRLAYGQNS